MASSNLPFPMLKSTGDDKRDIEVYIEDLIDYCVMNNWYTIPPKNLMHGLKIKQWLVYEHLQRSR